MKLLLLTHAFNSLSQRLHAELLADGHAVSVELDIADSVTEEAVALWQPDLVIAPFLKRRIPESVWSRVPCWVVHPGPPGDQGPSALDWALSRGLREWGVTVLQATGDYDAGPVWAWRGFALRAGASKSSSYRHEVVNAAVHAVCDALARWQLGQGPVLRPEGRWQPLMTQADRQIDWARDCTAEVLRKIRAADGFPGVREQLFGEPVRLFDAHAASAEDLRRAACGDAASASSTPARLPMPVARRGPAVLLPTADGGIWLGHVRREGPAGTTGTTGQPGLKLPTTRAFAAECAQLPELPVALDRQDDSWDELHYRELCEGNHRVGVLSFAFCNGAMSTRQCRRLLEALHAVRQRPTQVLVLDGGPDFFSNGIHLHEIEAEQQAGGSAADASMANIEAIDDVALALITMTDRWVISALRGNAGAGGCFLALAADEVWLHGGVVQNPHYKNMGNLYGSEYWTYLLPRRLGAERAHALMRGRLPLSATQALHLKLADAVLTEGREGFEPAVAQRALQRAASTELPQRLLAKQRQRARDEADKPLARYRAEELQRMRRNFYGFDASYHVARHHFVHRKPQAWTPRHLALHRSPSAAASWPCAAPSDGTVRHLCPSLLRPCAGMP